METVARFEIGYTRFLDPAGRAVAPLPPPFDRDPAAVIPLYRAMTLLRAFDAKAVALQRTGRLGTYAAALGQEAVGVAMAAPMRSDDVLVPSFREQGAQLTRGVSLLELLLYWGGDERGSDFAGPRQDFPTCVPVGSHAAHAVGVATAIKLRGEARAVLCSLGDGATSRGDVYEAMNLAGAWRVPVVFVIDNNQWAISVPRDAQTAARTLAQKAIAAGFTGEQVDGNDAIAIHCAVSGALERARAGGGPHLIEALTYRLADHTTSDEASRYRDDAQVSAHWAEDPIARLRAFLVAAGLWDKEKEEDLIAENARALDAAVETYLALPPMPATAMFDHLFAALPAALEGQRAAVAAAAGDDG